MPKKTIEDGIYKISMASHESQSVSIASGSTENGAKFIYGTLIIAQNKNLTLYMTEMDIMK